MRAPRARNLVSALASAGLLASGAARGQAPAPPVTSLPEEAPVPAADLVADASRFGFFAGATWGAIAGSEVDKADPGIGFEGAVLFRVIGGLAVWGGYAFAGHDVSGQVVELLDQRVRPDRRSGNVEGRIETKGFRAGVRLEATREPGWRWTPYVAGAVSFSTMEVTIDSVDGAKPAPVPDSRGRPVDISKFDDSQIGGLARFGVESRVAALVRLDAHATYEVLEFPAGTASSTAVGAGLAYRF